MREADVTPPAVLSLPSALAAELCAHARRESPRECCGLVGARAGEARSAYPLTNVAARPLVSYEAAPAELFAAQRLMRERGEQLAAIYHSHPQETEPQPSPTDVRLAFYPAALCLIIGFEPGGECVLRAFRLFEREGRWEPAPLKVESGPAGAT